VIGAEGAADEASRAGTVQARSRGTRSIVLAWAIAASIVVHAAILIATLPGGKPGIPKAAPPELRATLVPSESAPEPGPEIPVPVPPVLAATPERSSFAVPVPERAARPTAPPASQSSRAGWGKVEIAAEPLADRTRLGGYFTRQMNEFPVEVDRPVRLDDRIVVPYPVNALAQGREEIVAVWVVVDESGSVEQVYVTEGSEEFAHEVLAVVRAAHFLPAEDNLKPIRYPIALQFDFRARGGATARAK
jgi:TonB family protein